MNVMMVRSKVREENVADVEAAIEKVFGAIEQAKPAGVRYASSKLSDGVSFVALLELEDSRDNPLLAIPAFTEFQDSLKQWVAEPPTVDQMTVIGTYRLF